MLITCRCAVLCCAPQLLGPDGHGLAAFGAETRAYSALESVQGGAVPCLLAAGHLEFGVHVIATERVPGRPLSDHFPSISETIAAAAERALSAVHAACPGLCRGDVRLANVMVHEALHGEGESSSGGGRARAETAVTSRAA